MAAGKPILATNVGAASWLVNDGLNGFVANPGDSRDLAKKILVLMHNPCMRKSMGENGRQKARAFIWKNIAEQTLRYYRQISGQR